MRFFSNSEGYIGHLNQLIQFVEDKRFFERPADTITQQGLLPLSDKQFAPIRRVARKDMDMFYWLMLQILRGARQYFSNQPQLPQQQQGICAVIYMLEKIQPLVSSIARGALVYKVLDNTCDTLEFDENVYQFTKVMLDNSASSGSMHSTQLLALALRIQDFARYPGALYAFNVTRSLVACALLLTVAAAMYLLDQDRFALPLYGVLLVCSSAFAWTIRCELGERQAVAQFESGAFLEAVQKLTSSADVHAISELSPSL